VNRRPDIQGLRALAVLSVVAFHAGLPLPGGFVGVDVFFVISGFVITRMLCREHERTGRIDFAAFYVRRFKRLTPALALMVGATAVMSVLALSPLGPKQTVAKTGIGAMAFAANWVIAATTGGYFDAPAATNPLLHTWSLSVEEQFYLVFPALLALGWMLRRRSTLFVSLVTAVSLVAAFVGVNPFVHSWLLGFYSPLTRAWEFGAGALLALTAARPGARTRSVLALTGLTGLVASFTLIDGTTAYPGAWTLLPVGATVLLIAAEARVLSVAPLVRIGDWSYSIYLWHWPCIVFATLLWPEAGHARTVAAACSFLPALASYRWVERPFRTLRPLPRFRFALVVAAVVLSPVAVDAAMGSVATGSMAVANRGDLGEDAFFAAMTAQSYPCADRAIRTRALRWDGYLRCQQSKPGRDVEVAVIGDSHAEHLFVGLAHVLPRHNVAYYIVNDLPVAHDTDFERILDHVVAARRIHTVVVSAFWYVRGVHATELATTLRRLQHAHKRVFVTDDVPVFPFDAFGCKYRPALLRPANCVMPERSYRSDYATYFPQLRAAVAAVPGVRLLSTAHWFCGARTCDMARHGLLLYRDSNHLNANGSLYLARRLVERYPALAAG
jgi:peptidoglycan/LPS O-acetylase OafA/YrhL